MVPQAVYRKWKNNQHSGLLISSVSPTTGCVFKFWLEGLVFVLSLVWYTVCPVTDCEPSCLCSVQEKERDLLNMRVRVFWLVSIFAIAESRGGFLEVS